MADMTQEQLDPLTELLLRAKTRGAKITLVRFDSREERPDVIVGFESKKTGLVPLSIAPDGQIADVYFRKIDIEQALVQIVEGVKAPAEDAELAALRESDATPPTRTAARAAVNGEIHIEYFNPDSREYTVVDKVSMALTPEAKERALVEARVALDRTFGPDTAESARWREWCICGAKTPDGSRHKLGCPARVKADEARFGART